MLINRQTDQLLQEIQKAALCLYQSDICDFTFDERTKVLISVIPTESYELEARNDAVSYVLKEKCSCQTVGEAKRKLIEHR